MTASGSPRWRRYWDTHAESYDRQMSFFERRLFRDTRPWVGRRATGEVLEVAVGTGLNLPCYPRDVRLTGVDLSPAMLAQARRRATELGLDVDLQVGDAQRLGFPDEAFDTVVSTFALCAVADMTRAVEEMVRVLRPGGRLLLADHVAGRAWSVRAGQRLLELATVPLQGEHYRRRPLTAVEAAGLPVQERERFGPGGVVERLAARKPGP